MVEYLFVLPLLVIGFFLILGIRRELKGRDQWAERHVAAPIRRHYPTHPVRSLASERGKVPRVLDRTKTILSSNEQSSAWQSITPSDITAAFKNFWREVSHSCDSITSSQVSDAFEKFLNSR